MNLQCPSCQAPLPAQEVNVSLDVAFCRGCNQAWKISELVHGTVLDPEVDFTRAPAGTWVHATSLRTEIGASHRSLGAAVGTLAVALFWNGIVSIFVSLAIASTLRLLGFALPDWMPDPLMNKKAMGWGMTLFLWLFLTPFIAIGLSMVIAFLSALAGKTVVRITSNNGELVRGIGPLGWRKHFHLALVKDVLLESTKWDTDGGRNRTSTTIVIEMQSGKPIKFGSSLSEDRKKFFAAALRKAIRAGSL